MPPTAPSRVALHIQSADTYQAMNQLAESAAAAAAAAQLPPALLELVRIRASQLDGCAYCLDLHTREAQSLGEDQQRLHALAAWRRSNLFDDRERAALALTEAITLVHHDHVPDAVYTTAAEMFGNHALAQLIWAIAIINTYNRLAIATGT